MNTKSVPQIDQAAEGVIVAVDLAKSVYQLRVANQQWRGIESHRLTRTQFERWFINRVVSLVIMEACGSGPITGRAG
jgi:transposase